MRHAMLGVVLLLAVVVSMLEANGAVVQAAAEQDPAAVEMSLDLDRPTLRLIQQGLRNEGFDPGVPDGLFGPRTRGAIRRWQEVRGVPSSGYLDSAEAELLRVAAAAPSTAVSETPEPQLQAVRAPGTPPCRSRAVGAAGGG